MKLYINTEPISFVFPFFKKRIEYYNVKSDLPVQEAPETDSCLVAW